MKLTELSATEAAITSLCVSTEVLVPLVATGDGTVHLPDTLDSGFENGGPYVVACGARVAGAKELRVLFTDIGALEPLMCKRCDLSYMTGYHGSFGKLLDEFQGVVDLLEHPQPDDANVLEHPVRALDGSLRTLRVADVLDTRTGLFAAAARVGSERIRRRHDQVLQLLRSPEGLAALEPAYAEALRAGLDLDPLEEPLLVLTEVGDGPMPNYIRAAFGVLDVDQRSASVVPASVAALVRRRVDSARSSRARRDLRSWVSPEVVTTSGMTADSVPAPILEALLTLWEPRGEGPFSDPDAAFIAAAAL